MEDKVTVCNPNKLDPVLAEIHHINDLGLSKWYEVVYFDDDWRCYSGSKTFKDGEKVVNWKYCKNCLKRLETIDIIMPPYIEIDLKKMRKDKNLTLREVAKKIGISFSHINKIETGKIEKPGYDIVVSLYNYYKNI